VVVQGSGSPLPGRRIGTYPGAVPAFVDDLLSYSVRFLMAVAPTAGVLVIFWLAIRSLLQADRRERAAEARIRGAAENSTPGHSSSPNAD
jgi:hypothetical protein